MTQEATPASRPQDGHSAVKMLTDFGPLVLFLGTYAAAEWLQPQAGIYWATGVLMVATVAALAVSRVLLGRYSLPALVAAVLVVVLGGFTLWLRDPLFVKLKPTIANLLFAGVLGVGLLTGRNLLKLLIGTMLKLTDEGWHRLTIRWIGFFLAAALLNEIVWRNFSEPTWVIFKVLGVPLLTVAFVVAQIGFIKRYEAKGGDAALS
jgi:intracellular septation protein